MPSLMHFLHSIWKEIIPKGALVFDATCGGGHDTLALAKLALTSNSGHVIGLDIQQEALDKTQKRLEKELPSEITQRIHLHRVNHSRIEEIEPELGPIDFVAYNLGYFPGGDKSIITEKATTVQSLKAAYKRLSPGGSICVTCYVGHQRGGEEQTAVDAWIQSLDLNSTSVFHIEMPRHLAPMTRLIQKGKCSSDEKKGS